MIRARRRFFVVFRIAISRDRAGARWQKIQDKHRALVLTERAAAAACSERLSN
jgi:hypothetical protein